MPRPMQVVNWPATRNFKPRVVWRFHDSFDVCGVTIPVLVRGGGVQGRRQRAAMEHDWSDLDVCIYA